MRGLNDNFKRRKIFRYLHEKRVDIALVQETHSTKNVEKIWKNEWGGKIYFDHGESNARGVAILMGNNIPVEIKKCMGSQTGPFLILEAVIKETKAILANIYGPNSNDPAFFLSIFELLENKEQSLQIVGGDLNVVLDVKMDSFSAQSQCKERKAANLINNFLEEKNWVDIWRIVNGEKKQYTWRHKTPLVMSRLDYFLIQSENIGIVEACEIFPGLSSDHSFVSLKIDVSTNMRGPGYWKFNTTLLRDKSYIDNINQIIDSSLETNKWKDLCMK